MRLSITPMTQNKENLLGSDHEKTVHELQIQILELKSSLFESKFKVESLKKKLKKSQAENKELTQKLTELQSGTS
jgi:peptidoglycan hydrolase CwlO-like protein